MTRQLLYRQRLAGQQLLHGVRYRVASWLGPIGWDVQTLQTDIVAVPYFVVVWVQVGSSGRQDQRNATTACSESCFLCIQSNDLRRRSNERHRQRKI